MHYVNISAIFLVHYFLHLYSGLNQAATNFYSFDQGRIAAYRLFEMISRSSSTVNQEGTTLPSVQGNIEFRNVYFSYLSRPEIPILSGFYLTVPAKKAVALVGRNGSGKSSIIPLMERFYDPTLGMRPLISGSRCICCAISFKVLVITFCSVLTHFNGVSIFCCRGSSFRWRKYKKLETGMA